MFSPTCQTYFWKLFVAETISFFLVYYKFLFVICIRVYMLLGNFYKCKPINKNIAFTSKSYIKAIGVATIYTFPLYWKMFPCHFTNKSNLLWINIFQNIGFVTENSDPNIFLVIAILSSSFIMLHDEIANSQCRV